MHGLLRPFREVTVRLLVKGDGEGENWPPYWRELVRGERVYISSALSILGEVLDSSSLCFSLIPNTNSRV